jgi:hypothetical protein
VFISAPLEEQQQLKKFINVMEIKRIKKIEIYNFTGGSVLDIYVHH